MRRLRRDDSGAALLIALGFVSLFGLAIAAILSFADTSLRAADTIQAQRNEVYAADAAVEKVIADIRSNANAGKFGGTPCDQSVPDLNGFTVQVTCTADPSSGTGGGVGGTGDAIVTTATLASGEYGIYRDASGDLGVGGNIRANSTIELGGAGTLTATGDVTATGACDAGVTAVPPKTKDCGTGTVAPVPSYPSASINPSAGSRTACTAPGTYVKFRPGTYTSANALSSIMSTSSLCTKSLFYFAPGTYYFNFTAGDDEWVIDDANLHIVGGAPSLAVPVPPDVLAPVTPKPNPMPFPGACDTTAAGVQFVFSGASRMRVENGTVELCPVLGAGSDPPIAFYGSPNTASKITLTPTGSETGATFSNPSGAFAMGDGGTAKAALTKGQTGSVTLTGFNQAAIPAGASIESVKLRVAHQEGNGGGPNNNADFDSGSVTLHKGSTACGPLSVQKKTTMSTETHDAKACLSAPGDFSSIKATYSVTAQSQNNKALDGYLDGIAIDVTYANPGLAPASGCIIEPGFPKTGTDSTHCAILKVSGNSSNVAMHGLLYAPAAALDVNAASGSQQGYLRGIVARTIRANIAPSVVFPVTITTPSPPAGVPNDRLVELVARINVNGSWVDKLRATVTIKDLPLPGTTVTINRWNVVR